MATTYRLYRPPSPSSASTTEADLDAIRLLISRDLSEPYGIYVYRYFIYQWPQLCFVAEDPSAGVIGVVVCRLDVHRGVKCRGYIAMLAVATAHRGRGIATQLARRAIDAMVGAGAHEIVLETEVSNSAAVRLYHNLGFVRSKRMHRYYMNASDAFRLVLPVTEESTLRHCVLANELDDIPVSGT
ncbi:acyl-CoA N-acyltransferase [Limtongia smithiae]|uniref:acyl-CoA N-acyltransferase n=1 Tax=Limtongia smithiae TaxID=1125753 RepID=UPI0034CFDE81